MKTNKNCGVIHREIHDVSYGLMKVKVIYEYEKAELFNEFLDNYLSKEARNYYRPKSETNEQNKK